MTRFLRPCACALTLALGRRRSGPRPGSLGGHDHSTVAASAEPAARFHDAMRQLWEDHIVWTRDSSQLRCRRLPDLPAGLIGCCATRTTSAMPSSRSTAMPPATQLSGLLREHILGAAALLDAAKAGGDVAAASAAWYANAMRSPSSWPPPTRGRGRWTR